METLDNIPVTKNKLKRFILFCGTSLIVVLIETFIGLKIWIISEADSIANKAVEVFHKNKTESLMAVIESKDYALNEKNKAVWALGVLKDKRALPKLESLNTGQECNHDSAICQYEIKKAILKIKGEYRASWQASN